MFISIWSASARVAVPVGSRAPPPFAVGLSSPAMIMSVHYASVTKPPMVLTGGMG